jgi:hypothetical protein
MYAAEQAQCMETVLRPDLVDVILRDGATLRLRLPTSAGVRRFVAEVLPENGHMLRVFADAGCEVSRTLTDGEVEVSFAIASTDAFRARVDERDHVAVTASLHSFFEPKSVAVLGASRRRGPIGGECQRK